MLTHLDFSYSVLISWPAQVIIFENLIKVQTNYNFYTFFQRGFLPLSVPSSLIYKALIKSCHCIKFSRNKQNKAKNMILEIMKMWDDTRNLNSLCYVFATFNWCFAKFSLPVNNWQQSRRDRGKCNVAKWKSVSSHVCTA